MKKITFQLEQSEDHRFQEMRQTLLKYQGEIDRLRLEQDRSKKSVGLKSKLIEDAHEKNFILI